MKYLMGLVFSLKVAGLFSQCTFSVSNIKGTKTVGGIQVTVTSSGMVDSNATYCNATLPYMIGIVLTPPYANGAGSYTFNFSPPTAGATLNFSGITNTATDAEEMEVYVNSAHYLIPATGSPNGCDAMAVLTSGGNIRGCIGCGVSGWNGTNINGPINSLVVKGKVLYGKPNGSLFSLFICHASVTGMIQHDMIETYQLFPNPLTNETRMKFTKNLRNGTCIVYNSCGQPVKEIKNMQGQDMLLTRSDLPGGIYFVVISDDGRMFKTEKLIITD